MNEEFTAPTPREIAFAMPDDGRTIHLVDPPCGAKPDGDAVLFVHWPEVVTCPVCRDSGVNNLMGYNS